MPACAKSKDALAHGAILLALVSLALMVVALVSPSTPSIVVALGVAEVAGILSFALYGVTVVRELWRVRLLVLEERRQDR